MLRQLSVSRPNFIERIKDEKLKEWALDINSIWRQLGRQVDPIHDILWTQPSLPLLQVSPAVPENADRHSLIFLPNPFIVPGGRFRETYYWDTYWMVEGLLLCGMNDTARGMIENLAYLVHKYGLVPNGGRQYYTRRSQPPLLTQMVELFYNRTENTTFLHNLLPALVTEYNFWVNNRSIPFFGPAYTAPTDTPRPEAYREDLAVAERVTSDNRPALYKNLASGAESGWDFSTRWLAHSGPDTGQLSSISTSTIVAVDLSAILCSNEAALARLFTAVGNRSGASYFINRTIERSSSFDGMFWNETLSLWRDLRLNLSLNGSFYGSSISALVWRCGQGGVERDEKFLSTLESLGVLEYPGGIPASVWSNSTQQWDYPNAWAPIQWMLVEAWHDSPSKQLRAVAEKVARTWLTTTYLAWERFNHTMFEKYNCTEAGEPGGGGQYNTQTGFGWTNGVALKFLSLYPDMVISPSSSSDGAKRNLGWVSVIVFMVVSVAVSIPCLVWCRWLYVTGRDRYWGRVRNEHLIAAQGGISHSRPHSPNPTYTNRYTVADINGSSDIYNETLLEFDV
ncbi:Trehalase [Geodia barretti]|uniref:Trehalase n=1 Tax=Geodia barretti TaxID=519541 RepID=A0AA35RIB3_GEOBA|nr:Trehalase [Geodia barretti]